jgi:lipoyl-dependent peroxiredoxin
MAAESRAHARWHGDLMTGAGTIDRVGSGTFGPLEVTWAARIGEEPGKSSPEELIAAAHASCFSMALSNVLAKQGTPPTDLSTSVAITFVPGTGITASRIEVEGQVPGIDEAAFDRAADEATDGCPVSMALKGNVEVSVDARLVG